MSNENYISYSATQDFLSARRRSSTLIASGVMLCIFSPIVLLILISLTRLDILTWSINFATGIGVIILLAFIATAVALFIAGNRWLKVHENYEYEDCNLSNNVREKLSKKIKSMKTNI